MKIPDNILLKVAKPSRYTGGEYNTPVIKENPALRFAMCMPDVYEVAMSNLGIRILYGMLNERADTAAERCFAPWPDLGEELKANAIPLASLETGRALKDFDIAGFSLQYEMSYATVLYMLDLAGIPRERERRGGGLPIIIAGGPCTVNPAVMSAFVDVFSIGDGEDSLTALADLFIECKAAGGDYKDAFLRRASGLPGMYVPKYNYGGKDHAVRRAVITDLERAYYPVKFLLPQIEAVHDRAVLEIFRGCTRGCRFCQAGFIYRPVRERTPGRLVSLADGIVGGCGYEELSLSSLSTGDYPRLSELIKGLKDVKDKYRINLSLPSLRADSFEAEFTDSSRKSSLTFAPEAGTQRLRDVINKNITEEDIERSMTAAFESGYSSVKLYFMIGLPTETMEDIEGIVDIAYKIKKLYRAHSTSGKALRLHVSTSVFIPKPFTPFQREAQLSERETYERQNVLKDRLRRVGADYAYHDYTTSALECAFSRGDGRLSAVLSKAADYGCRFDGWTEEFKYGEWLRAFADCGVDLADYTRERGVKEPLPWDFVDIGVTGEYFGRERERAFARETTDDCRNGCLGCGLEKECGRVSEAKNAVSAL
ncbi:MAG: TIGR03960 family B12-binding radical SAM protein [Clostridiales bacterium]|jgi:radical SAM family uncharacterized protein|nr:TIGR03960 family B12-binding radical SAM protein [Clostridiales bacterium]